MRVVKVLLLGVGIAGAVFWLPIAIVAGFTGVMALAGGQFEYLEALWFVAPFVTFCSYLWVILRSWDRWRLLIWGVIAHLPLVYWLPHRDDEAEMFLRVAVLLFGLLSYAVYTLSVWKRDSRPPE